MRYKRYKGFGQPTQYYRNISMTEMKHQRLHEEGDATGDAINFAGNMPCYSYLTNYHSEGHHVL